MLLRGIETNATGPFRHLRNPTVIDEDLYRVLGHILAAHLSGAAVHDGAERNVALLPSEPVKKR